MKLFRGVLTATLVLGVMAIATISVKAQGLTVNLIMSPNPSPHIGDWATHRETAQLIVTNTSGAPKQVKLSTQISLNGSLVAFTKNQSMPILTIPPGAVTYDAGSLIPYNDVNFQGQIDQSVKRSGLLPEGMYQICVSLIDPSSFAQITQPVCQSFTILGYQQPILLSPADTSAVNASFSAPPPIFSWTPLTPAAATPVTYHLRIIELMPGQTPRAAFLTNPPLFESDVMNITQFVYTPNASPLRDGMTYVWSVQTRDQFGNVLGQGDGWAVPFSFKAVMTSGQPTIIDNKKGFSFIPDGIGVLIGSAKDLKDVTVRGWDPETKQGIAKNVDLYTGIVDFMEGDPDRPLIIGLQYNGDDRQNNTVNIYMPTSSTWSVEHVSLDHISKKHLANCVLPDNGGADFEDAVLRGMDKSHRLQSGKNGSASVADSSTGDGVSDNGSVEKDNHGANPDGASKGQAQEGAYNPKEYDTKPTYLELNGQLAAMLGTGDVNGDGFPDVAFGDVNGDGRPDNIAVKKQGQPTRSGIAMGGGDVNGDGTPDAMYYRKYRGKMGSAQSNPMYQDKGTQGNNPFYESGKEMCASPVIITSPNGNVIAGFSSVGEDDTQNGANGSYIRKKLPGKMKSGQIILTRGISSNKNLYNWISDVSSGQKIRKNITITMLSDGGKNALHYALYNCAPTGASGTENAIDPSDSTGKMELHGFSWGALSAPQGGNNKNSGLTADTRPCDTCPIDIMSYSWGAVALAFDSSTVDSTPVVTIDDLPSHIDVIAGPFGNVTGNFDLDKGRMTVLEPITIPGSGDALLLITGRVTDIDPFPDPPNVASSVVANTVKLAHRGEITSISSGGDNPTESRIKVQFHWDRQGKNDNSDNSIVEFVPDGNSPNGSTNNSRDYAVQYRETSFDAFYSLPKSSLPNGAGEGITPIVTNGGGQGMLLPTTPSPITITCSMGISEGMYNWIKGSMSNPHLHQSGIIHRDLAARNYMVAPDGTMSGNHKDLTKLVFSDAQISEIGLPALDASSKESAMIAVKKPGYPNGPARPGVTITFTPGTTQWQIDSISSAKLRSPRDPQSGLPTGKRQWDPVSFRLKIDGLEDASSKITGIGPVEYTPQKSDGEPEIAFSLPASDAKPFEDWMLTARKAGGTQEGSLTTRKAGGTQQEDAALTTRKAGEHPNGILEYLSEDGSVLYSMKLIGLTPVSSNSDAMHWTLMIRVQRIDMN